MKRSNLSATITAVAFTLILVAGTMAAENPNFHANLSGDEEVPPVNTLARVKLFLISARTALVLTTN